MKAKKVIALAIAERSGAGASAGGFAAMDRNNDGYLSRDERLSRSELNALGTGEQPGQKQ